MRSSAFALYQRKVRPLFSQTCPEDCPTDIPTDSPAEIPRKFQRTFYGLSKDTNTDKVHCTCTLHLRCIDNKQNHYLAQQKPLILETPLNQGLLPHRCFVLRKFHGHSNGQSFGNSKEIPDITVTVTVTVTVIEIVTEIGT